MQRLDPSYLQKTEITFNEGGYIKCRFSRPKTTESKFIADLSKPHYVYVERGAPGRR
jgi:hypothetical protein